MNWSRTGRSGPTLVISRSIAPFSSPWQLVCPTRCPPAVAYADHVPTDEPPELETTRFRLRPAVAADLEQIHAIFQSNPDFLALRRDIAAVSRSYDLAEVTSYWEQATLQPDRHLLVITNKPTGAAIGLLDFVVESPADGLPWLGLIIVHHMQQRRGVASEALGAVVQHLASRGCPALRMAVTEGNTTGAAFGVSFGFESYATAATPAANAESHIILMELRLAPQ